MACPTLLSCLGTSPSTGRWRSSGPAGFGWEKLVWALLMSLRFLDRVSKQKVVSYRGSC